MGKRGAFNRDRNAGFRQERWSMRGRLVSSLAVLACLLGLPPQASGAEQGAAQPVMPDALAALERMGEHLKTLKQFTLEAATTSEDVLDSNEKVMIGGNITYRVKIPDRLSLTIKTDKREREYFYDGATVTVYAPALKYYSVFPASDTIAQTIDEAESTYGIEVPLADLFYLGTKGSKADASNIVSAFYVSDSKVNGAVCAHYAYRTATANFQVWIPKEGEPLPCKIVRDIPDDAARPQYTAVLTWKPDENFAEDVFTFTPPEGAEKIEMVGGEMTAPQPSPGP
jgi:hypothetical protein